MLTGLRYCDIEEVIGQMDMCVLVIRARRHVPNDASRALARPSTSSSLPTASSLSVLERFLLPTAEATELWTAALLRLVTLAGFHCHGAIELPGTTVDRETAEWAEAVRQVQLEKPPPLAHAYASRARLLSGRRSYGQADYAR